MTVAKVNRTKKALVSSVLSMLLCFSMLIGTTFAWFTDTASTAVNKIQAGTLDVALEMSNDGGTTWENAEGKTLEFIKAPGHENEPVLWEPGCTYTLPTLRVINKGNLALKFRLAITGIKGDAKLNEAIEWKINGLEIDTEHSLTPGEFKELTIEGHMNEGVGNEYQGLSIEGIGISVVATQVSQEKDSFGDQYDSIATYLNKDEDGNWLIYDAADLLYFAKTVNEGNGGEYSGETVKLMADIDLAGIEWTPIGTLNASDGNGNPSFNGTFDGNGKTIKNLYINLPDKNAVGFFASNAVYKDAVIKNVTFENANVTGHKWVGVVQGYTYGSVINCTVKNSTVMATGYRGGAVVGFARGESGTTSVIQDNKAVNCKVFVGQAVTEAHNICVGTYTGNNSTLDTNKAEDSILDVATFIFTADDLLALSGLYAEGVYIIMNDINLNGAELKTIGVNFHKTLTIIGNGKTISNVKLVTGMINMVDAVSMFQTRETSTLNIRDLNLASIKAVANSDAFHGYAAAVIGYCEGTANLINVDISDGTIIGHKSSGALVGHLTDRGIINAEGCDISNTKISLDNDHYAGKYIGTVAGKATINSCTTTNVTVTVTDPNKTAGEYGRIVSPGTYTYN